MGNEITKFGEGQIYSGRFSSNYDHIVRFKIVRRTPQTATLRNLNTGDVFRKKIHQSGNGESIIPMAGIVLMSDRPTA